MIFLYVLHAITLLNFDILRWFKSLLLLLALLLVLWYLRAKLIRIIDYILIRICVVINWIDLGFLNSSNKILVSSAFLSFIRHRRDVSSENFSLLGLCFDPVAILFMPIGIDKSLPTRQLIFNEHPNKFRTTLIPILCPLLVTLELLENGVGLGTGIIHLE